MNMLFHNLKVGVRNLMKYKLQTTISVLSIAIGIVTLAFAHAALTRVKTHSICKQSYYERTHNVVLKSLDGGGAQVDFTGRDEGVSLHFTRDILRALKRDGGPKSMERMVMINTTRYGSMLDFQLCDSTARRAATTIHLVDPDYFNLVGIRSAITGRTIRKLKPGEAIISRKMASMMFGDADPRGAVCTSSDMMIPIPLTIVDIYEDVSLLDKTFFDALCFCLGGLDGEVFGAHNHVGGKMYDVRWVTVVLREGFTKRQLLDELNARLAPFSQEAVLEDVVDPEEIWLVVSIQTLVHLIGALILIAAIIGFLRMQIQLFWMRRREVSLRIVNGAKRRHLFTLLFTEVFLVVGLSVVVAMLMGSWVEGFIYTRFAELMKEIPFSIRNLAGYSLGIGVLLLLFCGGIIWIALVRICRAEQGLAAHMRGSRTHLFRNVMLGIQITISIVFVCGTLTIGRCSTLMLKGYCLPDDLTPYKESLRLKIDEAGDLTAFKREIAKQPSLDKMMAHELAWLPIPAIQNNPEVLKAFNNWAYRPILVTADTSLIAFYRLQVNWLRKPTAPDAYLLLSDSLYHKLHKLDVASGGMLAIGSFYGKEGPYHIAGTISGIPYEGRGISILIDPKAESYVTNYVLLPKAGKYQTLVRETEATIRRLEPAVVKKMAQNFHTSHVQVELVGNVRRVGWILGGISILICAMSIYSTIALDTRMRRKEVAVRKVNGAKSRDIYRLFGRVYFLLIVLSLVIAIPVAMLFHRMMFVEDVNSLEGWEGADISPLIPCVGGALIVIALIAAIVYWNIRSIMRTNPSEIIAKE